ncbi:cytidine deaminase [bacterium]|nr:cytidine deaminase [bacterium]
MYNAKDLVQQAINAKSRAMPTYSNFHVGAALISKSGKIYLGANIENSSYGLTMCAERTAVFTALIDGEREFEAIAIAGDSEEYISPCGACRQVLVELCGKGLQVFMVNNKGEFKQNTMDELIPFSFSKEFLK